MPVSTKGRRFPPEPLTRDDVDALMAACSRRAPTGIRNRALIALLYCTGLRISEALALQVKDVDFVDGTVHVARGKGGRPRTVGIARWSFDPIERWLDVRAELNVPRSAPLFCTLEGGRVEGSYVRAMLPRLGRRAGLEKRVHAHGFRHGLALALARQGVALPLVQGQLGHRSLATTSVYVAGLTRPAELAGMFAELEDREAPGRDPVDALRRQVDELRQEVAELRRPQPSASRAA